MAIRYNNFQPHKYLPGRNQIGGIIAVAAVHGMIVNVKEDSENELELANGKAGFFLTRDVVASDPNGDGTDDALKAYQDADELRPNKSGFQTPFFTGGSAQADDLQQVWVEGAALLDASITNSTAAGTSLTTKAGKLSLLTDSEAEECQGIIRSVVAAKNSAAPAKRFLVEMVKAPLNIPAAG